MARILIWGKVAKEMKRKEESQQRPTRKTIGRHWAGKVENKKNG